MHRLAEGAAAGAAGRGRAAAGPRASDGGGRAETGPGVLLRRGRRGHRAGDGQGAGDWRVRCGHQGTPMAADLVGVGYTGNAAAGQRVGQRKHSARQGHSSQHCRAYALPDARAPTASDDRGSPVPCEPHRPSPAQGQAAGRTAAESVPAVPGRSVHCQQQARRAPGRAARCGACACTSVSRQCTWRRRASRGPGAAGGDGGSGAAAAAAGAAGACGATT